MSTLAMDRKRIYAPEVQRLSVKAVCRSLGLPRRPRWEEARAVVKRMIVAARRAADDEQVVVLNSIYAYLKERLYRTCIADGCNQPTRGIHCYLHSLDHRYPVRNGTGR